MASSIASDPLSSPDARGCASRRHKPAGLVEQGPVVVLAMTQRTPNPALPLYGTDLTVRLGRIDITIYEDMLLGYVCAPAVSRRVYAHRQAQRH